MLRLSHTTLTLSLVAFISYLRPARIYSLSRSLRRRAAFPANSPFRQSYARRKILAPDRVASSPPPPPGDLSHESRYPHMCRRADPVSMSRIGCLASPRFNRCSLARRGVDYICVAQRRASQLTHGINERGLKKWGLRGKPLSV